MLHNTLKVFISLLLSMIIIPQMNFVGNMQKWNSLLLNKYINEHLDISSVKDRVIPEQP